MRKLLAALCLALACSLTFARRGKEYVIPDWASQLLVNDPLPGPDDISGWIPDASTPIGSGGAQTCNDVGHFDFRNASLEIASVGDRSATGSELIHLKDGTGFLSDDPDSPQSHDWRLELLVDRVEHPDPSTWIRVIVLDKNHLTGTGDWRYVIAFGCANGSLVRLFQYGSEGVTLKHLTQQTMHLYQPIWAATDAHCCPGKHLEVLYKWNAQEHKYKRASSISGKGFAPLPDEK